MMSTKVLAAIVLGAGCILSLAGAAPGPAPGPAPAPAVAPADVSGNPDAERIRGIVISTHRSGQDWGTDVIVPAFQSVAAVGANWVSTHPYAGIARDGTVRFRNRETSPAPEHWVRPIREAHAQGLKIFIKPHLAYWGSGFDWRGEIAFEKEEEWARFFAGYREWILALAEACRDADGFSVGTELDRTLDHEKEWRELIAEIRTRTSAALTYAANWSDYRQVPFWDAVDAIGIQAYFPVSERPDPPESEIRAGWDHILAELREYSHRMNRRVVFTEAGYSCSLFAPVRPWEGGEEGSGAEACQETCLRVLLEAVATEPSVVGLFLWKWFPPPHPVGRNYRLATPRIQALISSCWRPASSAGSPAIR